MRTPLHLDLTKGIEPDEERAIFYQSSRVGHAGERFYYSSPGYVLPAHIVERVSSQGFADFLDKELFRPVGMNATFAGNGQGRSCLAVGHEPSITVTPAELDVIGMGAGDIWSTAEDLLRWDRALSSGSVVSASAQRMMFGIRAEVNGRNASLSSRRIHVDG